MNFFEQILTSIKRMEKALGLKHKNVNNMTASEVLKYYNEICDIKDNWEEENQKELEY